MAEILSIISLVSYILAGSFLVLTVFFWFRFDIPKVIDDLTLKSAKKQIAQMHAKSDESAAARAGQKAEKSGKTAKRKAAADNPETGLLVDNRADEDDSPVTELMDKPAADPDATELLDMPTGLLGEADDQPSAPPERTGGVELTMLEEVMIVHTDEEI